MAELFFQNRVEKTRSEFWVTQKTKLVECLVGTIIVKWILVIKSKVPVKVLNPIDLKTYCSSVFLLPGFKHMQLAFLFVWNPVYLDALKSLLVSLWAA